MIFVMRRPTVFASIALVSLTVSTAVSASAATPVQPLVRVSGPSPLAVCQVPRLGGKLYREAEVEPHIAANPARPGNLIGVWQQDRFSNGGALGLAAGYSADAGKTWGEVALPFSRCAPDGLAYDRASDPVASIGPDGRAYAVALSFTPNNLAPNFTAADAIASATSTDGGRSWQRVRILDQDTNGDVQGSLDKEWVVADPTHPGIAYATWDHFTPNPDGSFHVPARFSRTTDGGRTWSAPLTIAGLPTDEAAAIDTPVVDPLTGAVYVFFNWSTPGTPDWLAFVKSADHGRTWSSPQRIAPVGTVTVTDPKTGEYLRTGDSLFSVAIDPRTGRLYLAWQSASLSAGQYDESLLVTSGNAGRTWTSPTVVSTRYGGQAFLPTIAVNTAGQVGLTWYDFRHDDPATPALTTDVWFRTVSGTGAQVSQEQHLSGPFNFRAAPDAGGRFVGDYQGMTSIGSRFYPFFAITNCLVSCPANRTDVVSTAVTPSAPTRPSGDALVEAPRPVAPLAPQLHRPPVRIR
jgi:BNR repeat-like domain